MSVTGKNDYDLYYPQEITRTDVDNIGDANRNLRTCHSCQKNLNDADGGLATVTSKSKKPSKRHAKEHERYRQKLAELRAREASTDPDLAPIGDIRENRVARPSRAPRAPREPRAPRSSRSPRTPRNKDNSIDSIEDNAALPVIPPPVDMQEAKSGKIGPKQSGSAVTVTRPEESAAGALVGHIGKDTSSDSGKCSTE